MTKTDKTLRPFSIAIGAAVIALLPTPCRAATGVLPWDLPLTALQDIIAGPMAHAAIVLNFACSGILYALGNRQFAGRLLAGGFASCAALIAVRFLTYLFPF
jgi:type IV secretory pathway VirB2 component (pilin)